MLSSDEGFVTIALEGEGGATCREEGELEEEEGLAVEEADVVVAEACKVLPRFFLAILSSRKKE